MKKTEITFLLKEPLFDAKLQHKNYNRQFQRHTILLLLNISRKLWDLELIDDIDRSNNGNNCEFGLKSESWYNLERVLVILDKRKNVSISFILRIDFTDDND